MARFWAVAANRQSVGTRRLSARDRQKAEPLPYSVMKISAWLVASGTYSFGQSDGCGQLHLH